jgi:peroxiredoxin
MNELRRSVPNWSDQIRGLVHEAVLSQDVHAVNAAVSILSRRDDSDALPYITKKLDDPDPRIRDEWFRYLKRLDAQRYWPVVVDLLDSKNPGTVSGAASLLRKWTGQNFGIQYNMDTADRKKAVNQWNAWINKHWEHDKTVPSAPSDVNSTWSLPGIDFTLPKVGGGEVRLRDLRGKIVLINFWATWCPPCIKEIPHLKKLQRKYPEKLVVLGISTDSLSSHGSDHDDNDLSPRQKVQEFIQQHNINYPVALDTTGETTAAYRASGLPTSVWIGPEGKIRRRIASMRSYQAFDAMFRAIVSDSDMK